MSLSIECPSCGRQYSVDDTLRGQSFSCDGCGESFLVAAPFDSPGAGMPVGSGPRTAVRSTAGKPLPRRLTPSEPLVLATTANSEPARPPDFAPPEAESRDAAAPAGTNWGELVVAAAVVALMLRLSLPYMLPLLGTPPAQPELANEPYALDDPSQRTRQPEGARRNVTFPSRIAFSPFSPGIVSARLQLGMPASEARPGSNSELSIYEPAGSRRARSLPCVLISPGGGTLLCGPKPAKGDDADWLEYARAGMAVVVFHVDGEIDIRQSSAFEVAEASARFFAAQAGLVNARNALEFVLARMPEVDPRRIYVAGQGSAATLALLFAEHEPRVAACIACARWSTRPPASSA